MKDLHNKFNIVRCIPPVAVGTTGTGKTGTPIDLQGYEGAELVVEYGSITATNAVFTVTVLEGDVTGTLTSVADGDLIGTEVAAGIAAGTPRADNVNKNIVKKIGYKGSKRYINAKVSSTITAAPPVSVTVIRGNARVGV